MTTEKKQRQQTDYRWLRWPSLLLGGMGVWGILYAKLNVVAEYSALFNLPSLRYCWVITAGAAILFGLSRISGKRRGTALETAGPQSWRGQ